MNATFSFYPASTFAMPRFKALFVTAALCGFWNTDGFAHLIGDPDHDGPELYDSSVKPPTNVVFTSASLSRADITNRAAFIAGVFQPFSPWVKTHADNDFFYVESDGMPAHRMMVGITAWQQQVPLPQSYFGDNAWRFPLWPVVATNPISAKTHFFRGAIAIAVNGVPIFNPIKNDGHTDTFLAGELDEFGGHAGRADDYHYHTAPLHLQKIVGSNQPIAFALDGYPIYGLTDSDGSTPVDLDEFNGHATPQLGYHYHASKKYPYLNGGFHGVVTERGGQVDPQPRAQPVRPATTPLPGAVITDFKSEADGKSYTLTYTIGGQAARLHYSENAGSVSFDFTDASGKTATKTYPTHFQSKQNDDPPSQRESAGQRPPRDSNRQPWMKVHAKEMDLNHDGILTRVELLAELDRVFTALDRNHDGKLTEDEYSGPPVRSPMGGYVKQHYRELFDETGVITKASLTKEAMQMFDKTDTNHDGQLSPEETALPPGYKAEPPGGQSATPPPSDP
jgi:YHYH protein/EF hand